MPDLGFSFPRNGRRCLATLLLALVAAAGCDLTGQYDKKFQEALKTSADKAVFDVNLHSAYTDVVDSARQPVGVKLRLPKVFDGNSKAAFQDTGKVLAKAGVAGAGGLPGAMVYSLTRVLDDANGQKRPIAVSMTAMPRGDQKPEAMQNAMAKGMAAVFPGAALTDVAVPTPTGQTLTLKRLRMEMALPAAAGKGAPAKTDNQQDVYFVDGPSHIVVITWVIPKAAAEQFKLDQAIEASMGSLEIAAPPPAAAPAGKAGPPGKAAAPAGKAAPPGCF